MLARGLFALHARYGHRPFETLVAPAEQMARFGVQASRALVRDLVVVAGPLAGDPGARDIFFRAGQPVGEGVTLTQPELSGTLSRLRTAGVGDLYQGLLARRLVSVAAQAGASLTMADLYRALPRVEPPLTLPARGGDSAAFLPPPADGGLAAAAAFQTLLNDPAAADAAYRNAADRERSFAAARPLAAKA